MAIAAPLTYTSTKGTAPTVDEPTHEDDNAVTRPGAVDLRTNVDAESVETIDKAWRDDIEDDDKRNRYSSNNPHLTEPFSTLEALVMQTLRRYGDMHPGTVDGEVMMMFVDFANLIIEDLRAHPYWENPEIDYYVHMQETREIPDPIMIAGLLYQYSIQQQSNKIEAYGPMYFKTINRILYNRKYGSGQIEIRPWDRKVSTT